MGLRKWNFPIWLCRKPDSGRKDVLACVDGSDASRRMLVQSDSEANPGKAIIRKARPGRFAAVAVGRTGTGMAC